MKPALLADTPRFDRCEMFDEFDGQRLIDENAQQPRPPLSQFQALQQPALL